MNLRILKKLSKRAVPYLERIGDTRTIFPAIRGDNYTHLLIRDRTDWMHGAGAHDYPIRELEICWTPNNPEGRKYPYCRAWPPYHPKKGTPMVGATEGYEEPEWGEETAFEALQRWVWGQHWNYDPEEDRVWSTFSPKTSMDYFRAADELLAAKGGAA